MFDIHDSEPNQKINITKVGAEKVKLVLKTMRRDAVNVLYPEVSLYVDLPLDRKGIHVSRSLESLNEVLGGIRDKPIRYIESFCAKIARSLLKKHEYSSRAEVNLSADYYVARKTPVSDSISGETCMVHASASAVRVRDSIKVKKFVGATVYGLTYCPCVLEELKRKFEGELKKELKLKPNIITEILKRVPIASHNQRCKVHVMVETSRRAHVDLDDLIEILEKSTSSPTYSLLKRGDEIQVILDALNRPMFVEDVLREVLYRVTERYPTLPDKMRIKVKVTSEESIHKYNIVSEHKTRIGIVRRMLSKS